MMFDESWIVLSNLLKALRGLGFEPHKDRAVVELYNYLVSVKPDEARWELCEYDFHEAEENLEEYERRVKGEDQ